MNSSRGEQPSTELPLSTSERDVARYEVTEYRLSDQKGVIRHSFDRVEEAMAKADKIGVNVIDAYYNNSATSYPILRSAEEGWRSPSYVGAFLKQEKHLQRQSALLDRGNVAKADGIHRRDEPYSAPYKSLPAAAAVPNEISYAARSRGVESSPPAVEGLTPRDVVVGAAHAAQVAGVGGVAGQTVAKGVGIVDAALVAKDLAEGKDVRPMDIATAGASVAMTAGATGPVGQAAAVAALAGTLDTTWRGSHNAAAAIEKAADALDGSKKQDLKEPADEELARRRRQALSTPDEHKPIFEKSGYEVPKAVSSQYVAVDGKYFGRDNPEKALFEDRGKTLATALEDRATVASMVAVAKAKGWTELDLRGTDAFRRQAWLEAESQGLSTRGYKPQEADLAALEALRQERSTNRITAAAQRETGAPGRDENASHVAQQPSAPAKPSPGRDAAATAPAAGTEHVVRQPGHRGPEAANESTPRHEYRGKLVEHGAAPYKHDPQEKASYFVTLQDGDSKQTFWGVKLQEAVSASQVKTGDQVVLERLGKDTVTVKALVRDQHGHVVGDEQLQTHRNAWKISPADQVKVTAAEKVLEANIAHLPAAQQNQLRHAFAQSMERQAATGKIDLPMPQVRDLEAARESTSRSERTR